MRDDIESASAHTYDWICHFNDGVSVDTASGWVQGTAKSGQSLGVRVLAPASWTATTGTQTAQQMGQFDPDGQVSWVQVRPASATASAQFLNALVPVAAAQWASRTPVAPLDANDVGAGAVVSPGSSLEERWIFARAGAAGKTAGDLVLTGAQAAMTARDAAGSPTRAVLFGPGSIADQSGGRMLLSTQSANSIETTLDGATLAVTGNPVRDFRAYAPGASAVTVNGVPASATFEGGLVTYPAVVAPPPADGGSADAGAPDSGDPGDLCGNCQPPSDGGPNPALDAGTLPPEPALPVTAAHGCSHAGTAAAWLGALALAGLALRRRRGRTGT